MATSTRHASSEFICDNRATIEWIGDKTIICTYCMQLNTCLNQLENKAFGMQLICVVKSPITNFMFCMHVNVPLAVY